MLEEGGEKMEYNIVELIQTLIGNIAFPIFVALAMIKENRDSRESHRIEMQELTKVLEKNTLAINTLSERMDK